MAVRLGRSTPRRFVQVLECVKATLDRYIRQLQWISTVDADTGHTAAPAQGMVCGGSPVGRLQHCCPHIATVDIYSRPHHFDTSPVKRLLPSVSNRFICLKGRIAIAPLSCNYIGYLHLTATFECLLPAGPSSWEMGPVLKPRGKSPLLPRRCLALPAARFRALLLSLLH